MVNSGSVMEALRAAAQSAIRYPHLMEIQRLTGEEVARFRGIRLSALCDAPYAFGTMYGDAARWPTEAWAKLLSSITVFVAVVEGSDVGMVRGGADTRSQNSARLGSLWVSPGARGMGIGRSLIGTVREWARSHGATELVLDVSDDNESAIALYARCGFEPNGEVSTLPPPREHLGKHVRVLKL